MCSSPLGTMKSILPGLSGGSTTPPLVCFLRGDYSHYVPSGWQWVQGVFLLASKKSGWVILVLGPPPAPTSAVLAAPCGAYPALKGMTTSAGDTAQGRWVVKSFRSEEATLQPSFTTSIPTVCGKLACQSGTTGPP